MTLQDILIDNYSNTIKDAENEWTGYALESEFLETEGGFDDLEREATVGDNGRIWFIDPNGARVESGLCVIKRSA